MSSRSVLAVSAAVMVGSGLWLSTAAIFCAATLHVPRILGRTPPGAVEISISAADHATLRAWWLQPSKSNGNCVIVLHGIADSRAGSIGFAPMFLGEGYAVLLPDSRGHGASDGRFVTYGLLEKYDVIGWADWMKRTGCQKLYGLGESLGASILIQAAAIQPSFSAIVAESPYADLGEIAAQSAPDAEIARRCSNSSRKGDRGQRCALCEVGGPPGSPAGLSSHCHRTRVDSHSVNPRLEGFPHARLEFAEPGGRESARSTLARV